MHIRTCIDQINVHALNEHVQTINTTLPSIENDHFKQAVIYVTDIVGKILDNVETGDYVVDASMYLNPNGQGKEMDDQELQALLEEARNIQSALLKRINTIESSITEHENQQNKALNKTKT